MALTHEVSSFGFEADEPEVRCGLIDPADMAAFERAAPEEEETTLFDLLCEQSDRGYVVFGDRVTRIDHRMEDGNEVRSVMTFQGIDDSGLEIWRAVSLISHANGRTYLETHTDRELAGCVISEPTVGSPEVQPGTHSDLMLHYRLAYEAATLPTTV